MILPQGALGVGPGAEDGVETWKERGRTGTSRERRY